MSSLAAARADGYYYGPDYDPSIHGSLNKYRGSHPLGARAKELHLNILVIRFELPYKVSCMRCDGIIDKGVRFNAKKKREGFYFSSPVYSFSFSCPFCSNSLVITTDPKKARYICTEGLKRRQEETVDAAAGNPRLLHPEERERLAANPIQKREHLLLLRRQRGLLLQQQQEEQLAAEETPQQRQQREAINSSRTAAAALLQQQQLQPDDYALNRRMREQLRQRKQAAAAAATAAAAAAAAAGGDADLGGEELKDVRFRHRKTAIDRLASQLAKTHASIFPKQSKAFSSVCKSDAVAQRLAHAAPKRKRRKLVVNSPQK